MQPPAMTDLSELLKQYGEAYMNLCNVLTEKAYAHAEARCAAIKAQITSLFASATEAGARIERDKILPLLKRIERAAQGLGGYIGQDGQLLKEVQKVIRESDTCETSNK
jgi:hypothetical protein